MATVLWLALLLCVGGALAQDLMLPSINIIEELGKLRRMEERLKAMEGTMQSQSVLSEQLRRMEERLKAMEGTMQSQSVLSEQLRRMEERLKAMEGTMQKLSILVEQLQKESKVGQCGALPAITNGHITVTSDGMELTVQCADHHTHIGPDRVWCVERKWTELPVCKARCKLDPKMTLYYSERYMEHGTEESLFCSAVRKVHIKCEDGTAYYRGCGRDEW